jgi:hypothetical protein
MLKTKSLMLAPLALLVLAGASHAGTAKTYQVTGPVLAVTNDMIAVQKGKDRWEIDRDASTKVTGDLQVGSKATIVYHMTAATVDVKGAASKGGKAK